MAKILVAEDNGRLRSVIGLTLEIEGHSVILTKNGADAMKHFDTQVDLVLSDIHMPDMDGIELLLELQRKQPGTLFLAMSGGSALTGRSFLHDIEVLGAAGTLAKPFTVEELLAAVDDVLAGTGYEAA